MRTGTAAAIEALDVCCGMDPTVSNWSERMRSVELKTQIWAFSIPAGSTAFQLEMQRGAQVVHVGLIKGVPTILARLKPDGEKEIRRFALMGTADDIPADVGRYLGTFEEGGYIWHVFEWMD